MQLSTVTMIILIGFLIWFIILDSIIKRSSYYKQTHKGLFTFLSDKGAYGEYLTYEKLKRYEKSGAKFLFNCYLPAQDEKTSEIDVIMLHTSGVYVFESKNYSGWIFGSEDGKTWTQTLPSGRKAHKEHFYNPVMQNRSHIKWLRKQIGDTIPVHSIIVFSERCELKNITLHSSDIRVIKRNVLYHTVCAIDEKNKDRISLSMVNDLYESLSKYVNVSAEIKEQHIRDINASKASVKPDHTTVTPHQTPSSDLCPKCGSPLVLRQAKKGQHAGQTFWGCSNYPKCRFTKQVSEQKK